MGQVRSMLRQAAWDHPGEPASHTLRAFELAAEGIGLTAMGTALLAHLSCGTDGRWAMTWTNAGHPPPILIAPDGEATLLEGHDILFGFPGLATSPRRDHHHDLAPGSTLFLYTDGLVERRGSDLDEGTDRLLRLLAANRGLAPRSWWTSPSTPWRPTPPTTSSPSPSTSPVDTRSKSAGRQCRGLPRAGAVSGSLACSSNAAVASGSSNIGT